MPSDARLFEIMYSLRAMRRFTPDPVPDALIERIVDAGIRAPSGGNEQGWSFIVVKDVDTKRFIQERYHRAFSLYAQWRMEEARQSGVEPDPAAMRTARAAFHLAEHMHEAPVLLFACLKRRGTPAGGPASPLAAGVEGISEGASIYPAVQNILLACRALGLGSVLTTLHRVFEDELKARLGVPDDVTLAALLPIGYPQGKFGPVTRRPASTVTYWDAWGAGKE